jgi:hypothetical protein
MPPSSLIPDLPIVKAAGRRVWSLPLVSMTSSTPMFDAIMALVSRILYVSSFTTSLPIS